MDSMIAPKAGASLNIITHRPVVLFEIDEHFIVTYKGVASGSGGREVEVGPVEEHACMSNAVSSHATARKRSH